MHGGQGKFAFIAAKTLVFDARKVDKARDFLHQRWYGCLVYPWWLIGREFVDLGSQTMSARCSTWPNLSFHAILLSLYHCIMASPELASPIEFEIHHFVHFYLSRKNIPLLEK